MNATAGVSGAAARRHAHEGRKTGPLPEVADPVSPPPPPASAGAGPLPGTPVTGDGID